VTPPRDPYAWAESWAWPIVEREGPNLSNLAGKVLVRLAAHGNGEGTARPSARKLGEMVGRSERAARRALGELRALGLIDGEPAPRRATRWRFVTDEDEQARLRHLRPRTPQMMALTSATPYAADEAAPRAPSATPAPQNQTRRPDVICGASAAHLRPRMPGKVKVKELHMATPSLTRDAAAAMREIFPRGRSEPDERPRRSAPSMRPR